MSTININVNELENKIKKLRRLKTQCENINVQSNSVEGSGKSINALKNVDDEYAIIKNKVQLLLNNSILFFENMKQSVIEADEESASKTN